MMRWKYAFVLLLLISFFACETATEENSFATTEFDELVEMHCRARTLKDQRFSLAEEMRTHPVEGINYDSLKVSMAQSSRALSDSIREKLTLLTGSLTLEEKRVFNDSIEARIERMGCR
jgi:hypothetical protein